MVDAATTTTIPAKEEAPAAVQSKPARRSRAGTAGASTSKRKSSSKKVAGKIIFVKSKRKTAVARASVRKGTGIVRVNGFDISTVLPVELKELMLESLHVS